MSLNADIPFVLVVEDNEGDILLIKEALTEGRSAKRIVTVGDGQAAIDFLSQQVTNALPLPQIMLIDINLPKLNGHELLRWMQDQEALRQIRVLVLSTSGSQQDIHAAYASGAAVFLTKPIDLDDFTALFDSIETFWFKQVSLP